MEVIVTGLAVGVSFAWRRRNVVSVDDPEGQIAPMYCCSLVRDDGRREEIHDRTSLLDVNCEREVPRIYTPSLASPDVLAVEMNEREEREGVVESERLVMSMKREAPIVAEQSVNVTPSIVSAALSERVVDRAPPSLDAEQRVKFVDPLMERDAPDVSVTHTAAPLPSFNDRSAKLQESIVADVPDWMDTAEVVREMAVLGVDDAKVMLVRERVPTLTSTSEHDAVSSKSMFAMVAVDEGVSRLITNSAVHPETVSAPTDFEGLDCTLLSLVMENPADVMVVVLISIVSCLPSSSSIEVTQSDFTVNALLIVTHGSSFHPHVAISAPDGPT